MSKDTQIQTFKGNLFDFLDLENNIIDIEDVAHSLANQCRWTGHTKHFYSIAQHSCYCYDIAWKNYRDRPEIALEALLHDGSEFAMIDLSRPLKSILPDYSSLQLKVEKQFAYKFGIPELMSKEVREIDDRMLVTEYYQLFNKQIHPNLIHFYVKEYPKSELRIAPWTPEVSNAQFLDRYWEIVSVPRSQNYY